MFEITQEAQFKPKAEKSERTDRRPSLIPDRRASNIADRRPSTHSTSATEHHVDKLIEHGVGLHGLLFTFLQTFLLDSKSFAVFLLN